MFTLAQNLAQRLSGERVENLVVGLAEARQTLHDAIEAIKKHEILVTGKVASERKNGQTSFPNEDTRKAEVVRRLEADPEYADLKNKLQDARVSLMIAEAELEREKADHAGMVALTGFIAAMVNAGKAPEAELLNGILGIKSQINNRTIREADRGNDDNKLQQASQNTAPESESGEIQTGAFMVLEARESRPGTVRGYCQSADGNKVAIYAKNGHGQTLANAVGGFVQVSYRKGDKGLIATNVKQVS